MIRVFVYLAWRSAYNRLARQLRQLKSPRYLAALALGLSYLWVMAVEQRPAPAPASVAGARWLELLGAIGVVGAVAWGWIFGVERRVLAFTPAEVTFLFSGPVPRRGLIQYKLLRNQLLILFNSLLWTLILARERFGASPWLRALSIWVLLTTLSLHRLGASFVRTSLLEHGRFGLRHRVVSLLLLGGVFVGLAWSLRDALPLLAAGWAGGVTGLLNALTDAAAAPLPRLLLAPFRAMVRPLTAHSPEEWLRSMGPALLLL
ncbi:MAG TPA: putative ABC exporter domain-containing protein, partial [Gemmatimonadales bacterium]|nr:putative ABC exporter domain-containing protein [Gemmatimonadales bacterium]